MLLEYLLATSERSEYLNAHERANRTPGSGGEVLPMDTTELVR